jgi:hypothetical protein
MEQSSTGYQKCQEELTQMRVKNNKMNQERDNALSLIIEKSIDIKTLIQNIDEKATTAKRTNAFRTGSQKQ